ncbi:MAG: ABC transporter ATP-binding protein [Bacteroidales bacterium]|nr:ABC transporter ATP-binding protein [Bacteroidales bacterium]
MDNPAIITDRLSIGYTVRGGVRVVHPGLDLKLCRGEVTALLGRNGAGKSTLLKTLCGLLPPLGGGIFVEGKPLGDYRPEELAATVGVVLTESTQAGGISVYDLVALGRYPHTGFFGTLRDVDHSAIRSALETAGIADKSERHLAELSDGERQKAFIAKVLAQECPIILLDEPTAFLDVTSRLETMVSLRKLAHAQGKAVLISTHDLDTALQLADKLWLQPAFTEGKSDAEPMLCDTPAALIESGALSRFFSTSSVTFDPVTRRLVARQPQ